MPVSAEVGTERPPYGSLIFTLPHTKEDRGTRVERGFTHSPGAAVVFIL